MRETVARMLLVNSDWSNKGVSDYVSAKRMGSLLASLICYFGVFVEALVFGCCSQLIISAVQTISIISPFSSDKGVSAGFRVDLAMIEMVMYFYRSFLHWTEY
jgi:hypothetical protein